MGLFKRNKNNNPPIEERKSPLGAVLQYGGSNYTDSKALKLSAVYRCVDVLCSSLASLPIYPCRTIDGFRERDLKNPIYKILNEKPNPRMNRFTFIQSLMQSVLLSGNGFAYIDRNSRGEVLGLYYLPPEWVTLIPPQYLTEAPTYSVTGIKGPVKAKDMIHILNFTYDGMVGISTLKHAENILKLSYSAEQHALGFYSSGCGVNAILSSDKPLNDEAVNKLKSNWRNAFGEGSNGQGSMVVVEGGMKFSPISIDPQSSQLLECRNYNARSICAFFGVPPTKAFIEGDEGYKSLESNQLAFLTDSLGPIISKFENEFTTKLFGDNGGLEVRFDTDTLLRNNKNDLANYYSKLWQLGAVTTDEIRRAIDLPSLPNGIGSEAMCQVNVMPMKNALKNSPADKKIDNPLKDNSDNSDIRKIK